MSKYQIDVSVVNQKSQSMSTTINEIRAAINNVGAHVAETKAYFQGNASTAFSQVSDNWGQEMIHLNKLLDNIQKNLDLATKGSVSTEADSEIAIKGAGGSERPLNL